MTRSCPAPESAIPDSSSNQPAAWRALQEEARGARRPPAAQVFGSDVAFRMVDFAQRNAERAGVGDVVQLRGGDALQRVPPTDVPGLLLLNPPYGERIEAGGVAGARRTGREQAQQENAGDFFTQLAAHWKKHYAGWTAWVLSPDLKLPTRMRLKESRRTPLYIKLGLKYRTNEDRRLAFRAATEPVIEKLGLRVPRLWRTRYPFI